MTRGTDAGTGAPACVQKAPARQAPAAASVVPPTPRGQSPRLPGPSVGCPEGPLCTQDTERGPSEVDPQLGPAQGQGRGHTAHKNQAHSGWTSLQPSEAGLPASDHRRVTEEAGLQGDWEKQGAVPWGSRARSTELNPPLDGAQTWVGGWTYSQKEQQLTRQASPSSPEEQGLAEASWVSTSKPCSTRASPPKISLPGRQPAQGGRSGRVLSTSTKVPKT